MTNSELNWWYRKYNRKYFKSKLPAASVRFKKYKGSMMGEAFYGSEEIFIARDLRRWPRECQFTLLHEMCHFKVGWRVCHGPKFQKEMLRLAKAGAFKGVW